MSRLFVRGILALALAISLAAPAAAAPEPGRTSAVDVKGLFAWLDQLLHRFGVTGTEFWTRAATWQGRSPDEAPRASRALSSAEVKEGPSTDPAG